MKSQNILIALAVIFANGFGCSANAVEVAATQAAMPESRVTVETTVYQFDDEASCPTVTKRSYVITGEKAGAPAEELLDLAPEEHLDRRRYQTQYHRKIIDDSKIEKYSPESSETERSPATRPASQDKWLGLLLRGLLTLFGLLG